MSWLAAGACWLFCGVFGAGLLADAGAPRRWIVGCVLAGPGWLLYLLWLVCQSVSHDD